MNISGVIVRTLPRDIDRVSRALRQLHGVEVHGANQDGRLVVTVEQAGERAIADAMLALQTLPGVLSASMVYHQFEETETGEAVQ